MQPVRNEITRKITDALHPELLEVIDDSHLHVGHAGHNPAGESHFRVKIVSKLFAGKPRLECHRMVIDILGSELTHRIHSISYVLSASHEENR